ncbi:MAG: hypothetical protein AB7K24_18165 [Gemmataceae bacterium]
MLPGFGVAYARGLWAGILIGFAATSGCFTVLYPCVGDVESLAFWNSAADFDPRQPWCLLWFILAGINAVTAFVVAARGNQDRVLPREPKHTAFAGLLNLFLPGLGVAYALDDIRKGCLLTYWEWGLINATISLVALYGGLRTDLLLLLNFIVGYLTGLAASKGMRSRLGWCVDESRPLVRAES